MIVVPNLERVDHHQLDIANFVHTHNYAISCKNFEEIIPNLNRLPSATFTPYQKSPFIPAKEICKILNEL
jgi:beta-1,4-N-acetylglucosaminyltransferase